MQRAAAIAAAVLLGLLTSAGSLYALVGRSRSPYFDAHQADKAGELDTAIVLFEKAISAEGEAELKLSAQRRLAALYIVQGGQERAAQLLQGVVASQDSTVEDLEALIDLQWRIGGKTELIGLYNRLLLHPDARKETQRDACWRLVELGDIKTALGFLKENQTGPDGEGIRALYLRLLTHLGDYDEAQVVLRESREAYPDSPPLLAAEGGIYLALERLEEADALLQRSLELHPTLLRALLDQARVKERLGESGAAERLIRRAVAQHSGDIEAQLALAGLLLQDASRGAMSALSSARVACDDLKDAFPNHGLSFECAGRLALVEGERTRGERLFARALELSPGLVEPGLRRARTLQDLGDPQQALRVFERLTQTFGERLDVRLGQARVLAALDEERRARTELEGILRDYPSFAPAKVSLADLWMRGGREFHAESLYKEVLVEQPWELTARYGLAELYFQRGRVPLAKQQYEGILERDPGAPVAHLKLAGTLATLGQPKAALDEVALALELGLSPDLVAGERTLDPISTRADFKRLLDGAP